MRCANCPCPEICMQWPIFCKWAAKIHPEPTEIMHICGRSRRELDKSPEYPSLFQQATNLTHAVGSALASAVRGEPVTVPQEEQDRRLAICHACEFWDSAQARCSKCGCFGQWKTWLASQKCPLNPPKW